MLLFLFYDFKKYKQMNSQAQAPQMATPISNLPLKTSPPQDQAEIEDPLIQNVLKEFEDDMKQNDIQYKPQQPPIPPQYQAASVPHPQYQAQHPPLPQYNQPPQPNQYKMPKKLLDMKTLKNAAIIAIIVFLLQNYNIANILMQKLPETVTKHIAGKEFMLNFILIFGIFYGLMYFDLL